MSCNNTVEMILGEKKWLSFKVTPCGTNSQYFSILSATYELVKLCGDSLGTSDDCVVDNGEKIIKCLLQPTERGNYILTVTWVIGEEIFKEKVRIEVC